MAKKKAQVVEPEETEEELELEELEEDEGQDAPAVKAKKKKGDEVTFGATDLAAHLSEKTGQNINARGLRVLLRKMARDGRIVREVTAGNRTRYNWSGPNDPEVKAIVKAVTSGEIEQEKKQALEKLKSSKAAQGETPAKKVKAKKAPAPVEDDEDEDFEDDDE